MYGCESWTIKKAEHQRTDAFELWCWRRLLRVPWTTRRSNHSILREISPKYSLEGLIWSWSSNTLATCCKEPTHWIRPWSWERLKAKGEGGGRAWDSQIISPTWVWANSGIVKDRGTWHAVVHTVANSQTLLSYRTTNGGLGEGEMSR